MVDAAHDVGAASTTAGDQSTVVAFAVVARHRAVTVVAIGALFAATFTGSAWCVLRLRLGHGHHLGNLVGARLFSTTVVMVTAIVMVVTSMCTTGLGATGAFIVLSFTTNEDDGHANRQKERE